MLSWVKWAFSSKPQIFVDAKRINPEIQAERRRELYGSMGRRRKIMDRMMQGYACTHPSWIQEMTTRDSEGDKPHLAA
ncbi:MAG TPA: hypothetical protein VLL75_17950 [Vicinamibacteria bacterium]|jgi:hypothetical protein|nr:hypothetical protein [Vicinamibacteria bacterium]